MKINVSSVSFRASDKQTGMPREDTGVETRVPNRYHKW